MCLPLWVWVASIVYMAYLAWQDWRTREITGIGAWPLLLLAWPIAYACGWLRLALVVVMSLVGVGLWLLGVLGGEDARALPFITALAPDAIVWGGVLHLLTWPARKIMGKEVKNVQDPGFVIYTAGLAVAILLRIVHEKGLT